MATLEPSLDGKASATVAGRYGLHCSKCNFVMMVSCLLAFFIVSVFQNRPVGLLVSLVGPVLVQVAKDEPVLFRPSSKFLAS